MRNRDNVQVDIDIQEFEDPAAEGNIFAEFDRGVVPPPIPLVKRKERVTKEYSVSELLKAIDECSQ